MDVRIYCLLLLYRPICKDTGSMLVQGIFTWEHMLRIMIQADLTKKAYIKLFDALSNVMAAIKKDRSYQTLVLVLIIAFTIALIFNTILSYRWIITSSNYGSINLHDGNRRHLQERRQQNDALVGHTHNSSKRVIYAWDTSKVPLKYFQQNLTDFTGCEYSNCVLEYSDYPDDASSIVRALEVEITC